MIKEVWFHHDEKDPKEDGRTKRVAVNGSIIRKIDKNGRTYKITDETGNVTTQVYDEWEMLTEKVYPDKSKISIQYDNTFHKPIKRTDEKGVVTEYEYDAGGNLTRKVEGAGTADERETLYTYDADGNVLT
ncbi:MAG: hypothetical protein WAX48_02920, partial [Desulfosalsimonadaceae bacterium]